MKRVLLTGATGFVGRNAIAPLVAKGYEVHAVSSRKQSGAMRDAHCTVQTFLIARKQPF